MTLDTSHSRWWPNRRREWKLSRPLKRVLLRCTLHRFRKNGRAETSRYEVSLLFRTALHCCPHIGDCGNVRKESLAVDNGLPTSKSETGKRPLDTSHSPFVLNRTGNRDTSHLSHSPSIQSKNWTLCDFWIRGLSRLSRTLLSVVSERIGNRMKNVYATLERSKSREHERANSQRRDCGVEHTHTHTHTLRPNDQRCDLRVRFSSRDKSV